MEVMHGRALLGALNYVGAKTRVLHQMTVKCTSTRVFHLIDCYDIPIGGAMTSPLGWSLVVLVEKNGQNA